MRKVKITRELASQLDTLARELPPIAKVRGDGTTVTRKVQLTGQKILDDGYTPKTKGEPPINPKTLYLSEVVVFYNHRMELENAYQRGGHPAVADYCSMIKLLKSNLDNHNKAVAPKESFVKKLFKKLQGK